MRDPAATDAPSRGEVHLIPFDQRHLNERYVRWLNDPEVTRFSELRHRRHTLEDGRHFVERLAGGGHWLFAIHFDRGCGESVHVGNLAVYFDRPNQTAEMSILIGEKEHWGKGVGASAWRIATLRVFKETNVYKIWGGTLAGNLAMIGTMTGIGMVPDGIQRAHMLWNDQRMDVVRFALFRSEACQ